MSLDQYEDGKKNQCLLSRFKALQFGLGLVQPLSLLGNQIRLSAAIMHFQKTRFLALLNDDASMYDCVRQIW